MAVEYSVLSRVETGIPAQNLRALKVKVLVDVATQDDATPLLRTIAREQIGTFDRLRLFAYLEREAVQWHGYIARVEHRAGGEPKVFYDNDPVLRYELWAALNKPDNRTR